MKTMYRSMRASVEKFDVAKGEGGGLDDDLLYGNADSDAQHALLHVRVANALDERTQ